MNSNLEKLEDNFQEDEINIYEIINIFIKNIKLFIIVSIVGLLITCLYIGKRIVFDKNNILTMEYTLNYIELESYLGGRVYYPKKVPTQILLENEYLEKLFENEALKEIYEKSIKVNREDPNTKRQFLIDTEIIKVIEKKVDEEDEKSNIVPNSYKIMVKLNRKEDPNNKNSNSILISYLKILKEYYNENIFKYIENRKNYSDERLPILKQGLEENSVMTSSLSFDKNTITENNFLRYIYPTKVSNIDAYYPEYVKLETENQAIKTLFELKLNNIDSFIQYDTSPLIEKEETGNFIKLVIGIFLSLCLAILATFIKEFFEGYKKSKKVL